MARHGYRMQIWPNGEFTVGYVAPTKFTPEPLPEEKVRVFSFDWLEPEQKYLVLDWVKTQISKQEPELDLPSPANSHKRGLGGITTYGARLVRNAAYLLQLRYGKERLSFVTLTLPTCTPEELATIAAQWSHIVRVYIQELKRELERNGLYSGTVGVTEVQEKRLKRRGELGLHLHLVHVGRASRRKPWAIDSSWHREVWGGIIQRILGRDFDRRALECVQAVESSAAGYLGKYMTKGVNTIGEIVETYGPDCVPSSWYTCTNSLRDAVKSKVYASFDLGEAIWPDLPVMEEQGVLAWVRLHQTEIGGRSFTVGLSGKWNIDKLRNHREYKTYFQSVVYRMNDGL